MKRKISFGQLPAKDTPLKKEDLSPSPVGPAKPGLRRRVRSGQSRLSRSSPSGAGKHLNASPTKGTGRLGGAGASPGNGCLCLKREAGRVPSLDSQPGCRVRSGRARIAPACVGDNRSGGGGGLPVRSTLSGAHSGPSTLRYSVDYCQEVTGGRPWES